MSLSLFFFFLHHEKSLNRWCGVDLWGSSTKDCSGVVKKRRMDENNRKITVYNTVYNVVQRFDKFTAFEYRRWTTRKCRIIACKHFCRRHGSPIVRGVEGRLPFGPMFLANPCLRSKLCEFDWKKEKEKLKMILCKLYF